LNFGAPEDELNMKHDNSNDSFDNIKRVEDERMSMTTSQNTSNIDHNKITNTT
jgi:hypothetical protein